MGEKLCKKKSRSEKISKLQKLSKKILVSKESLLSWKNEGTQIGVCQNFGRKIGVWRKMKN